MDILLKLTPIATITFVLSSMLAMGLSLTVTQIVTPLKNVQLISLSVLIINSSSPSKKRCWICRRSA